MIVVVMGVSGCGKTTVGSLLAKKLGCRFFDADEFHPPENIAKMAAGKPLDDDDRAPWLANLNRRMRECEGGGESAVFACSALKRSYRERLALGVASLQFVHLRGDAATIRNRLLLRQDHYMKAGMLESQFAALEEPAHALIADIADAPEEIAERIRLGLQSTPH